MTTTLEKHENLYDLVKDFSIAMLTTRSPDGALRARPMAVAELKRDADAYFATSISSPKIDEIAADPNVSVSFQSSAQFASISGTATVVRDRALIDRLWKESWRVWFPGGKDDPNLCLLRIEAKEAEYWDNSGAQGLKYLFKGLAAVLQGKTPDADENQHAKVRL